MIWENNNLEHNFNSLTGVGLFPPLPHTHSPIMKPTTNPNITPDDVIMHQGAEATETSARTPSTGIGAWLRQQTLATYLLLAAAPALTSCEKLFGGGDDPKPVVVEKKDTPEARAAYMADVKPIVLGGGIATLDFEPEWMVGLKDYQLQPKSLVDFEKAAQKLEEYAVSINRNVTELAFALYYRSDAWIRIAWKIPYSLLKELGAVKNLNDNNFDQYIVKSDLMPNWGNPDANVSKNDRGYLSVDFGELKSDNVLLRYAEVSPYYFAKTQ